MDEHTAPEKILLAALKLEQEGKSPFSAESIVVAAWQEFPRTFGLKGYADQYPDSNKVLSSLMGQRGLVQRGFLNKMGQKLYSLTREGRRWVAAMTGQPAQTTPEMTSPGKRLSMPSGDRNELLQRLFDSAAVHKHLNGKRSETHFTDACRFWGITTDATDQAQTCIFQVRGAVEYLLAVVCIDGEATVLGNGRCVEKDDAEVLRDVNAFLEQRFARHLALLTTRSKPCA
jgi:hypothetical protein